MSAPVLNIAMTAPTGGAAQPAGAPGAPLDAFQALLAALFPQGGAGQIAPQASTAGGAEPDEGAPDAGSGDAAADGETLVDPALALVTNAAAAPDSAGAEAEAPPAGGEAGPPHAWGHKKAKGAPAAPALAHAAPNADLAEKAAGAAEAAPDETPADAPAQPVRQAKAEPPPNAQAIGQRATAAPPPAAAPPSAAAAPAAAAPPSAVEAEAPAQAQVSAIAAEAAAEPAAAAVPPRSAAEATAARGRPEPQGHRRGKPDAALEAAGPATPRASPAGPKPAAAEPPGKPAAPEPVAAPAETAFDTAEAGADAPDLALAGEPQATSHAAGSSAHPGAQSVRGAPETVASLAAQIVKKLEGRSTRFEVELDPAGLGRVDVRVEIGANGRITAALAFDNPAAAQELKARAGELTRALEQAGFDLSGGLSFDLTGDRGHARQDWQAADDSAQAFRGRAFQAALGAASEAEAAAVSGPLRLRRGVTAGLDLRI